MQFRVEEGWDPGAIVSFSQRAIAIGRGREAEKQVRDDHEVLRIPDPRVSRRHAFLRQHRDGSWTIEDRDSANGVELDGRRIPSGERVPLDESSVIRIGDTRLRVLSTRTRDEQDAGTQQLEAQRASIELEGKLSVEALDQVGRAVLSARSLEELLGLALELVLNAIDAEHGALLLADADTGRMVPRTERPGASDRDRVGARARIVDEVVSRRAGVVTADIEDDERFAALRGQDAGSVHSALCVPLWSEDRIQGAIYLESSATGVFTSNDLLLADAIANLIAIRLRQEQLNASLAEQRIVRANLERYHSPDVVEAILSRPEGPDVGLEDHDVSVLFADMQGSTALAEKMPPSAMAELLNAHYDLVTEAVFAHGGTVNEYVGDSVLAIFGAPARQDDHARRAVSAGLDVLRRLRERRAAADAEDVRYGVRVAVNSGHVVAGSVGPPNRLKYAVIGDAVNVAARLEKLSDVDGLVIGENTLRDVADEFEYRDMGAVEIGGREERVRVYAVTGHADVFDSTETIIEVRPPAAGGRGADEPAVR